MTLLNCFALALFGFSMVLSLSVLVRFCCCLKRLDLSWQEALTALGAAPSFPPDDAGPAAAAPPFLPAAAYPVVPPGSSRPAGCTACLPLLLYLN